MTKLTIIIPVYNREKTITRALDSVIPQLNKGIELMIINDGSTDKTENVIKEYISKYNKYISYYAKENEGIAATRNFGITHAKDDYIMFVDSDDYIDESLIKELQPYLDQEIDVIKFKASHVNEQKNVLCKIDGPIFSKVDGQEAFDTLAFSDILMDSPCVYAFRKSLFIANHLFFKTGTYHEDFGLIPRILLTAKSVVSIDVYGYYYVQTDDSITRNDDYKKTIKRFEDSLSHYDDMLQWIGQFPLRKKTEENVKIYYTNAILLKLKTIKKEDRAQYIQEIKKRKMIRNIKPKNIRQLLKRILLSININWYLKLLK